MKSIQVILTIDVDNDSYSMICNKSLSLESLVYSYLENGESQKLSFDFPAVLIPHFLVD